MVGKKTAVEAEVERPAQAELFLTSKLLVVVLKIIKPAAGLTMASRCVVVIRGGNSPFVVLLTSNCADAAGVVVPIPTFWAILVIVKNNKTEIDNTLYMIVCLFVYKKKVFFFLTEISFPMDANALIYKAKTHISDICFFDK
jgi:hypothetical protein